MCVRAARVCVCVCVSHAFLLYMQMAQIGLTLGIFRSRSRSHLLQSVKTYISHLWHMVALDNARQLKFKFCSYVHLYSVFKGLPFLYARMTLDNV